MAAWCRPLPGSLGTMLLLGAATAAAMQTVSDAKSDMRVVVSDVVADAASDEMSDPLSDALAPDTRSTSGLPAPGASANVESMVVVRSSPLAGFQFHAGEPLWQAMQVGDPLTLVREPDNPHDPQAIRVDWRGIKLGYVPRRDNRQVARQIDLGAALEARISRLREARNPWDRIEFEVVLVLRR